MAKSVQLSEDAYRTLTALKRPGESYSDVVRRLARERTDIGALLDLEPPDPNFDFDALREVSRAEDVRRMKSRTTKRPRRPKGPRTRQHGRRA